MIAIQIADAALGEACAQQFQAARYPGEQIVEVMREAAGQLTDRLHLLCLE